MADIEKIISDIIWKEFNNLRGYVDLRTSENILRELLFFKLLIDQLRHGNKYFCERINGAISLDVNIEDMSMFYVELNKFISSNECLSELSYEIFNVQKKIDNKLMIEIIRLINSVDTVIDRKPSLIFMILLNSEFRGSKSEIITSPSINKLISSLLKNKDIHEIYDPTIGTGMLALDVASSHENIRIYGQDINRKMINICKMLLILDERIEDLSNIAEGNTIINPGHIENNNLKKFQCIVGNPPFGLKDWGYNEIVNNDIYNRFHRGLPSRSLADYAFISHVIESLSDTGIAIMIENTGVLFKEGAEGTIRKSIIEENLIDMIIALPNNMMYGTAIPVNLMIFNKNKKTDDILFIDVSNMVQSSKVLTSFTDNDIEKIVKIYNERSEIEGTSKRVSLKEIEDNSYNLTVGRYVNIHAEKEEIDINEIGCNIEELNIKLQDIQNKIKKILSK